MKMLDNSSITLNVDLNTDDIIRSFLNEKFSSLPRYKFSTALSEDDEYLPTVVCILVPFNDYHVIMALVVDSEQVKVNIEGTIELQDDDCCSIFLCEMWFINNDTVNFIKVAKFDNYEESLVETNDLLTEIRIIEILQNIVSFYLTGRLKYMSNTESKEMQEYDIKL